MTRWLLVVLCACGGNSAEETTLFPADYATAFTQVRACVSSTDHDLNNVLVFVDPTANEPYTMRDNPFPTGAIVLKEEHSPADMTCGGPITEWTVMVKMDDGSSPTTLDWHWQRVQADRTIETDNDPRCYNCHVNCIPPDGYLDTCSPPPGG